MLRICVVQIKKYEKKKNETKSSGTDKKSISATPPLSNDRGEL
jgi:hypothetical protein